VAPASISLIADSITSRDPQTTVTLTNSGIGVLNISSITSDVGSLVVSNVPTSIAANGGTATFTAKFTHTGIAGIKFYTITINSNSTTGGAIQIPVYIEEIVHGTVVLNVAGNFNWTVPFGTHSVTVNLLGGGGGGGGNDSDAGSSGIGGCRVVATIVVIPGEVFTLNIGGGGAAGISGSQGHNVAGGTSSYGFNGGAGGGAGFRGTSGSGGGGGAATVMLYNGTPVLVAGGGGGGGGGGNVGSSNGKSPPGGGQAGTRGYQSNGFLTMRLNNGGNGADKGGEDGGGGGGGGGGLPGGAGGATYGGDEGAYGGFSGTSAIEGSGGVYSRFTITEVTQTVGNNGGVATGGGGPGTVTLSW